LYDWIIFAKNHGIEDSDIVFLGSDPNSESTSVAWIGYLLGNRFSLFEAGYTLDILERTKIAGVDIEIETLINQCLLSLVQDRSEQLLQKIWESFYLVTKNMKEEKLEWLACVLANERSLLARWVEYLSTRYHDSDEMFPLLQATVPSYTDYVKVTINNIVEQIQRGIFTNCKQVVRQLSVLLAIDQEKEKIRKGPLDYLLQRSLQDNGDSSIWQVLYQWAVQEDSGKEFLKDLFIHPETKVLKPYWKQYLVDIGRIEKNTEQKMPKILEIIKESKREDFIKKEVGGILRRLIALWKVYELGEDIEFIKSEDLSSSNEEIIMEKDNINGIKEKLLKVLYRWALLGGWDVLNREFPNNPGILHRWIDFLVEKSKDVQSIKDVQFLVSKTVPNNLKYSNRKCVQAAIYRLAGVLDGDMSGDHKQYIQKILVNLMDKYLDYLRTFDDIEITVRGKDEILFMEMCLQFKVENSNTQEINKRIIIFRNILSRNKIITADGSDQPQEDSDVSSLEDQDKTASEAFRKGTTVTKKTSRKKENVNIYSHVDIRRIIEKLMKTLDYSLGYTNSLSKKEKRQIKKKLADLMNQYLDYLSEMDDSDEYEIKREIDLLDQYLNFKLEKSYVKRAEKLKDSFVEALQENSDSDVEKSKEDESDTEEIEASGAYNLNLPELINDDLEKNDSEADDTEELFGSGSLHKMGAEYKKLDRTAESKIAQALNAVVTEDKTIDGKVYKVKIGQVAASLLGDLDAYHFLEDGILYIAISDKLEQEIEDIYRSDTNIEEIKKAILKIASEHELEELSQVHQLKGKEKIIEQIRDQNLFKEKDLSKIKQRLVHFLAWGQMIMQSDRTENQVHLYHQFQLKRYQKQGEKAMLGFINQENRDSYYQVLRLLGKDETIVKQIENYEQLVKNQAEQLGGIDLSREILPVNVVSASDSNWQEDDFLPNYPPEVIAVISQDFSGFTYHSVSQRVIRTAADL